MTSLRKFFSEIGFSSECTRFAHSSNAGIVRDAALERDRVVLRLARALALVRRVAALAVDDRVGRALERAHLRQAGHVLAVPLDAEHERLVGVEAGRVDGELGHLMPSSWEIWVIVMTTNSAGFSGAKPTTTLTRPRSISDCGLTVVVADDEEAVRLGALLALLERALAEQARA